MDNSKLPHRAPKDSHWSTPIGINPDGTANLVGVDLDYVDLTDPAVRSDLVASLVNDEKKPKRGHQTQWAAQSAVASELCKRGYEVSFTMGNTTPLADLMVVSPKGEMLLIDVKGLYRPNPWIIKRVFVREGVFPQDGRDRVIVRPFQAHQLRSNELRDLVLIQRKNWFG
jgi:hypothetical protein